MGCILNRQLLRIEGGDAVLYARILLEPLLRIGVKGSGRAEKESIMRNILSENSIHPDIREKITHFHSETIIEVENAIQNNRIVVVGMRGNNSVRKARKNLFKAGLAFQYLEYGSYLTGWYRRLPLKMWTGFPTFPMIFVDQKLIGGNADLEKLLENGAIT